MTEQTQHRPIRITLVFGAITAGLLLLAPPAGGQVVIDMPPPPSPPPAQSEATPAPDDDEQEKGHGSRPPERENESTDDENHAEAEGAHAPAMKRATRRESDDLGRLAITRYTRARAYARPSYSASRQGYQPRGYGIGPLGLGHHRAWYGRPYAIAPTVFIGGRGDGLFR